MYIVKTYGIGQEGRNFGYSSETMALGCMRRQTEGKGDVYAMTYCMDKGEIQTSTGQIFEMIDNGLKGGRKRCCVQSLDYQ